MTTSADQMLLAALRSGDEDTYVALVEAHSPAMLRVARLYVRSDAVAEEVVQETWLAVLGSLESFEGRSSLRTWIFAILGNLARKRAQREDRSTPAGAFTDDGHNGSFFPAGHRWAGMWTTVVDDWDGVPEEKLLGTEARSQLRDALAAIPARYAVVFVLRDVEGWSSDEVCGLLGLSAENQRVLLHRARLRIRAALAQYFGRSIE